MKKSTFFIIILILSLLNSIESKEDYYSDLSDNNDYYYYSDQIRKRDAWNDYWKKRRQEIKNDCKATGCFDWVLKLTKCKQYCNQNNSLYTIKQYILFRNSFNKMKLLQKNNFL